MLRVWKLLTLKNISENLPLLFVFCDLNIPNPIFSVSVSSASCNHNWAKRWWRWQRTNFSLSLFFSLSLSIFITHTQTHPTVLQPTGWVITTGHQPPDPSSTPHSSLMPQWLLVILIISCTAFLQLKKLWLLCFQIIIFKKTHTLFYTTLSSLFSPSLHSACVC